MRGSGFCNDESEEAMIICDAGYCTNRFEGSCDCVWQRLFHALVEENH
jgi:hypothetical protein